MNTNLLGVLFLDSTVTNVDNTGISIDYYFPPIKKQQSTIDGFGNAFSFRLNIKTDSIIDDTASPIYDNSTSEQLVTLDFNDVLYNLNQAIELLMQQTGTINYLTKKVSDLEYQWM